MSQHTSSQSSVQNHHSNIIKIGDYVEVVETCRESGLNQNEWGKVVGEDPSLTTPSQHPMQVLVRFVHLSTTSTIKTENLRLISLQDVTRKFLLMSDLTTPVVTIPKHPVDDEMLKMYGNHAFTTTDASLMKFTPFEKFQSMEIVNDFVESLTDFDGKCDKAVGAMVGMCIADAVGHPLEFVPAVDKPFASGIGWNSKTLQYTKPLNQFQLKPGQWTDDAAMGLCLADSLLATGKNSKTFDGSDTRARFHAWWFRGYNNAFAYDSARPNPTSVGLGGNISKSLRSMVENKKPTETYETNTQDAGNGSLMRLAPVAIRFWNDPTLVSQVSQASSYTTHPGPIAACACDFMSYVIAKAISYPGFVGVAKPQDNASVQTTVGSWLNKLVASTKSSNKNTMQAIIDAWVEEYLQLISERSGNGWDELRRMLQSTEGSTSTEVNWNWRDSHLRVTKALSLRGGTYNGYPVHAGYFGSYSIDGLALALHCIYHTTSFSGALEKCVNFLGDADSTGSMVGQMAGAFYGFSSIDGRLVKNMHTWDPHGNIKLRAALLFALGKNWEANE